nr:MAG TPA: hypothetical protein [Caudoviricetes sp.]
MSILKYKDPKTGEFKRINPYKVDLSFVGKDGITIDKAADSEKIEISGSGLVPKLDPAPTYFSAVIYSPIQKIYTGYKMEISPQQLTIPYRDSKGNFKVGDITADDDGQYCANKKYVDDNYVKKLENISSFDKVYTIKKDTQEQSFTYIDNDASLFINTLPIYVGSEAGKTEPSGSGRLVCYTPVQPWQVANKKYVDNADKDLYLKFTNLEQALNGYILDTTEEAYADLDSAVLKDNVTVGDNVYPIADKTRALVTRIEGKTTKMVQLLDKSTFPATSTPTAGVTVTKTDDGGLYVLGTSASSGGRNSWGITVKIEKGHKYLSLLKGNNKITTPFVTLKSDTSQYVGFVADIVTSTIEGECYYGFNLAAEDYDETIYPQLFDLTAMNREDITTAEQFKAEFPELYPYENGNIYPAKISGVKFTGKNLLKLKLSSTNKCTANIEDDVLKITPTTSNAGDIVFAEVKTHLKAGEYVLSSISENQNTTPTQFIVSKGQYGENNITTIFPKGTKFTLDSESDIYILIYPCLHSALPFKAMLVQIQIQAGTAPTAYEPYIDPVSVTLPETYDLHGIGDYKDYLEIIKNENNELYTLKKVQSFEVNESEKTVTPLATPVETVIATNLTYEQVTAIRHNGGLIEVEGNTNKGYAKPTVTNTIVYRLTAANTAEV